MFEISIFLFMHARITSTQKSMELIPASLTIVERLFFAPTITRVFCSRSHSSTNA